MTHVGPAVAEADLSAPLALGRLHNPVILLLFVAAASAVLGGGFVALAPNRLVSGRPIGLFAAVDWRLSLAIVVIGLTSVLAAATFAIVDGLLFKPLPYRHADELYIVSAGYSDALRARTGATIINRWGLGLSLRDMQDLAAAVRRFEASEPRFDPARIRAHAERFSPERFRAEIRAEVDHALRG